MKKIINYTAALLCAAATLSCQKSFIDSDGPAGIQGNISNPISFYADCGDSDLNANVSTKSVSEVTTLESFYVNAVTGAYGSETSAWSGALFQKESEESSIYTADKLWPAADPDYSFYACNVQMTGNTACKVSADASTDIVCAYLESSDVNFNKSNKLSFEHIYSRIGLVTINTQDEYQISDISISISCPVSGTYDIYMGEGSDDDSGWSTSENTAIKLTNGKDNDVYVVPGKYDLSVSYILKKGSWSNTFQKTASVTLAKGKVNKITGTATGGSASEIEFTVSVEEWGTNNITIQWD